MKKLATLCLAACLAAALATPAGALDYLSLLLCFDSTIDAESFAAKKSAIFLILPEEDSSATRSRLKRSGTKRKAR